jgi:hypothetical protein
MLGLGVAAGIGGVAWGVAHQPPSLLPPLTQRATVVRPSPNVVLAVRELRRLETAEMHTERIVDARSQERLFFGAVEAEDSLLLVAAGDIVAGVDLSDLHEGDVQVDWPARKVRIALPAPQIFSARLDAQKSHVHSRHTDLLAHRHESLESEARAQAEKDLAQAAKDAGILDRAGRGAEQTVDGLLRALGFRDIQITVGGASGT